MLKLLVKTCTHSLHKFSLLVYATLYTRIILQFTQNFVLLLQFLRKPIVLRTVHTNSCCQCIDAPIYTSMILNWKLFCLCNNAKMYMDYVHENALACSCDVTVYVKIVIQAIYTDIWVGDMAKISCFFRKIMTIISRFFFFFSCWFY